MILLIYGLLLLLFSLYSYSLVDPNITFIQNSVWVNFREVMIFLGYHRRFESWLIYLSFIILLFIFHYLFVRKYKNISILRLVTVIVVFLSISYPFLSHDLFNYIFDAKILTYYYQNPYTHRALDFPQDSWIRFMHWTHRTYPYGPLFLLITIVPSFFGFGKFLLTFIFFKLTFIAFYAIAVIFLSKVNKKWAIFFATHPYVLVEGLVNTHNDLLGVALVIVGLVMMMNKKQVYGRLLIVLSVLVKYITLPISILVVNKPLIHKISFVGLAVVLIYVCSKLGIQQWYFLNLFVFIPFYFDFVKSMNIFFMGLLLSYFPYIRLGGWDTDEKVYMKNNIIYIFIGLNIIYILLLYLKRSRIKFFTR